MLRPISLSLIVLALVASCGKFEDNRTYFDGAVFRAKAKKQDKDRAKFFVTVSKASRTLTGARQAGEYEATSYCITNFGTSNIVWAVGPDAEDAALLTAKDTIVLRGECQI